MSRFLSGQGGDRRPRALPQCTSLKKKESISEVSLHVSMVLWWPWFIAVWRQLYHCSAKSWDPSVVKVTLQACEAQRENSIRRSGTDETSIKCGNMRAIEFQPSSWIQLQECFLMKDFNWTNSLFAICSSSTTTIDLSVHRFYGMRTSKEVRKHSNSRAILLTRGHDFTPSRVNEETAYQFARHLVPSSLLHPPKGEQNADVVKRAQNKHT